METPRLRTRDWKNARVLGQVLSPPSVDSRADRERSRMTSTSTFPGQAGSTGSVTVVVEAVVDVDVLQRPHITGQVPRTRSPRAAGMRHRLCRLGVQLGGSGAPLHVYVVVVRVVVDGHASHMTGHFVRVAVPKTLSDVQNWSSSVALHDGGSTRPPHADPRRGVLVTVDVVVVVVDVQVPQSSGHDLPTSSLIGPIALSLTPGQYLCNAGVQLGGSGSPRQVVVVDVVDVVAVVVVVVMVVVDVAVVVVVVVIVVVVVVVVVAVDVVVVLVLEVVVVVVCVVVSVVVVLVRTVTITRVAQDSPILSVAFTAKE